MEGDGAPIIELFGRCESGKFKEGSSSIRGSGRVNLSMKSKITSPVIKMSERRRDSSKREEEKKNNNVTTTTSHLASENIVPANPSPAPTTPTTTSAQSRLRSKRDEDRSEGSRASSTHFLPRMGTMTDSRKAGTEPRKPMRASKEGKATMGRKEESELARDAESKMLRYTLEIKTRRDMSTARVSTRLIPLARSLVRHSVRTSWSLSVRMMVSSRDFERTLERVDADDVLGGAGDEGRDDAGVVRRERPPNRGCGVGSIERAISVRSLSMRKPRGTLVRGLSWGGA